MKSCKVKELCNAVGGILLQDASVEVCGVSTDSRKIAEGDLFIPLVGEHFDGHAYIESSLRAGAAGCLTSRKSDNMLPGKFYILVDDTLAALKALASWYRDQFHIPFVQITGSSGKTTTKEMLASVLSQRFHTLKTQANFNNAIGTPQTLLRLADEHEVAVIETGMNHFGEIRYLGEMVRPEIAVITNVGDAHIENLGGTRQGTLQAKSEIFENLAEDGVAILCGDDELLKTVKLSQEILLCGKGDNCNVRVADIEDLGIEGVRCSVTTAKMQYHLMIPSPGEYMIYSAAMAVAIGEKLGLTAEEIERGVAAYRSTGSRMHLIRGSEGRLIIDDCYNANPQAMAEALKILSVTKAQSRVAVLGDMGELGTLSEQAHRNIGRLCGELGIDTLIAIGRWAQYMADSAECKAYYFATIDEAIDTLHRCYKAGTAVLVKASHAMNFGEIVKELEQANGQ